MSKKKSKQGLVHHRASLAVALVVLFVPFLLHYHYLLNTFYHFGAVFFDTGWLANTVWRNALHLPNPYQFGDYSVFAVHAYVMLAVINLLSYLAPLSMPEFYAVLNAGIYAGLGLAMFAALRACTRPRTPWQLAWLGLLSIGFAFNGVLMQGVWMTHIEYAIPLGVFLFFLFYATGRISLALVCFAATLLVREDAGFHLAALLILLALIKYREQRSIPAIRKELVLIVYACGYSLLAWGFTVAIRTHFGLPNSLFALTFSGTPAYAHLSWDLLSERAQQIFMERTYIWLGALVTFGWAAYRRDLYLAIGFTAYIPWFLLNWTAKLENTGVLYAYYAFPFVVSLGWPVLAALWRYRNNVPQQVAQETLKLQALLVIIGLVVGNLETYQPTFGPSYWARWGSYSLRPAAAHREVTDQFIATLGTNAADLGTVTGDGPVLSLAADPAGGRKLRPLTDSRAADTLLYFNPFSVKPSTEVTERVQKHYLPYHYCIEKTSICAFSNRPPERLGAFTGVFVATPVPK